MCPGGRAQALVGCVRVGARARQALLRDRSSRCGRMWGSGCPWSICRGFGEHCAFCTSAAAIRKALLQMGETLQSPLHRSPAFTSQTSPKLAPAVLDMPNPESLRKKKRGKSKPKSSQGHQALFSRRMSCLNPGVLPPLLPKSAQARVEWDQM